MRYDYFTVKPDDVDVPWSEGLIVIDDTEDWEDLFSNREENVLESVLKKIKKKFSC